MRASLRVVLAAGALAFLVAGELLADTVYRKRANQEGVNVYKETFKKVFYTPPGSKLKQDFDYLKDKVIRVEYENWPEEWDYGRDDLANSRFQDAYDAFIAVSKASADSFPQARQYGLYWACETLVKWAEAGNGRALGEALKTFDMLMQAEPETVHLAKVFIGKGKCYLLMGKKAEALAEFNKVFREEYFKPEDKVAARVQMALIAELGKQYRKALDQYTQILGEANQVAPDAVPLVKVRMAACKVGLEQYDEALDEFDRLLSSAKTAAVKAAAYNGRGECHWKKKEYETAMWDFLRVVVLYETITSESPKAFYYASMCMKNMAAIYRKQNKKEEEKLWRGRSRGLFGELKEKFPGSPWVK